MTVVVLPELAWFDLKKLICTVSRLIVVGLLFIVVDLNIKKQLYMQDSKLSVIV